MYGTHPRPADSSVSRFLPPEEADSPVQEWCDICQVKLPNHPIRAWLPRRQLFPEATPPSLNYRRKLPSRVCGDTDRTNRTKTNRLPRVASQNAMDKRRDDNSEE